MRTLRTCCLLAVFTACLTVSAQRTINLAGKWTIKAEGLQLPSPAEATLPGSMLTNHLGHKVTIDTRWTGSTYDSSFYFNPHMAPYREDGNVKFPFFLTPDRHFVGKARYGRTVTVPREWKKRRVVIFLERPHIETTVYVNGRKAGHDMSLSTPHQYDITDLVKFGKPNNIEIEVYNGIENVCVGQDSHSVTDQTQGNWNGIAGRMELQSRHPVTKLRAVPDLTTNTVTITVNEQQFVINMGDSVETWDEFHPRLYTRSVVYRGDTIPVTFGMRQIDISGPQIRLNGKPVWMRGTVENCTFPETGFPPTDVASWERIFRKCKDYGLNHIRFHSYCPPDAAFTAADRLGLYLQPEGPSWPNHGVRLRRGQSIDQYLLEECKRIVDTYGHHPSFVMMAAGNEPAGDWVAWCNDFVKEMMRYDPSRIYCGASVGGGWAWDDGSQYHVKGGARGLDWDKSEPQSADDYYQQLLFPRNYKGTEPNHSPIIAHEQGQWCAFPDLEETSQYTGVYQPRNFEIFADLLRENGMEAQARPFLMASGRLQTLCYKYEIERNLRTKDYAGFQLLSLNDYSGQGTALVGPLTVHWNEKGYCDSHDWTQFCSPIVPLAQFPRFVFENTDTLVVPVAAYNATGNAFRQVRWRYVVSGEGVHWEEEAFRGPLAEGKTPLCFTIKRALGDIRQPLQLSLRVSIWSDDATLKMAENQWDFWVYPHDGDAQEETSLANNILITDTLDAKALDTLRSGGRVLLTAGGKIRHGADVKHHFLPVFWNTSWFKMRPPHTTGCLIQAAHPVFRMFPTDDWQNLNWWQLVNRAQVMNLDLLPADFQPIIQPIDTWHHSRKLGMMFEANMLGGKLLMTTLDISHDLDRRIAARQLRRSILAYMQSPDFNPQLTLEPETVTALYEQATRQPDMFTNESPDELKPKLNP